MAWIFLSPHFDDVALSCGGLVWELVHAGELVSIWTICAGEPPEGELSPFAKTLHTRWEAGQNAPLERKAEDILSCHRLGASYRHFNLPDCIYRRAPLTGESMYSSEQALNGPLHPGDGQAVKDLYSELHQILSSEMTLICPLALGNHVDHQLTRLAAEALGMGCWYYADFPYVLRDNAWASSLAAQAWESHFYPISDDGLSAWQGSISAYGSQISTFWPNEDEMRRVVSQYMLENGGIRLWSRPIT